MKKDDKTIASFLIATVLAAIVVTIYGLVHQVILPLAKWLSVRIVRLTLSASSILAKGLLKSLRKKEQAVEPEVQVLATPNCFAGAANLAKAKEFNLNEI